MDENIEFYSLRSFKKLLFLKPNMKKIIIIDNNNGVMLEWYRNITLLSKRESDDNEFK